MIRKFKIRCGHCGNEYMSRDFGEQSVWKGHIPTNRDWYYSYQDQGLHPLACLNCPANAIAINEGKFLNIKEYLKGDKVIIPKNQKEFKKNFFTKYY